MKINNLIFISILVICFLMPPVSAKKFVYNQNTMTVEEIDEVDESENIDEKISKITNLIIKSEDEDASKEAISLLYWLRAKFYEDNLEYTKALSDYNQGLKYTPEDINILKSLVNLKLKIKDYEGALSDINKVIDKDNNIVDNYMKRAQLYFELKQYQNAIKDYTKAITLKPKNPEAFEMRGCLELLVNQKDKGFQDLGYAKQQYYELERYDEYQSLVKYIEELKSPKNTVRTYTHSRIYIPMYENSGTERQLKEINENIKELDRTIFLKGY